MYQVRNIYLKFSGAHELNVFLCIMVHEASHHRRGTGWTRHRGCPWRNQTYCDSGHVLNNPVGSCFFHTLHRRTRPCRSNAPSRDYIRHGLSTPQGREQCPCWWLRHSTQPRSRRCAPSNPLRPSRPSNHTFANRRRKHGETDQAQHG